MLFAFYALPMAALVSFIINLHNEVFTNRR